MCTPVQMYDSEGKRIWDCTLNIYGKVADFRGESLNDCPFRFQGQYEDAETGLYYNRFRYYDAEIGHYLSQDPIKLLGSSRLYEYVINTNFEVDIWGLRPLRHGVGDVGEKAVSDYLKSLGYITIDAKYGSNNGIDILAKNPKTGKYDVFEVKSSMYNNFIFSEDQLKPQKFIQTRLQRASRISQQEKAKIMSNLGDRKIAYVNVKC